MKKLLVLSLFILALVVSYNCKKAEVVNKIAKRLDLPSIPYRYDQVKTPFGQMDVLYEDGSLLDKNKATIGRVLFYDKALSMNNSVACASCHKQENAFADNAALSVGFEESKTIRNSIGINNLRDEIFTGYFWDARERSIESMVFAPIANHIEMGFERVDLIAEKLNHLSYYQPLFKDYYGDDAVTEQRIRECLAQFLFSIVSNNNRLESNLVGSGQKFTDEEQRGMKLFSDKNCATCHLISDNFGTSYGSGGLSFANNGIEKENKDNGMNGNFKIPRLRNISKTAPYMHDGRFKTLEEVLEHYSHGIKDNINLSFLLRNPDNSPMQFNFTDSEKSDLIAFLKTLDDDEFLKDPKFSSPFK